MYTVGVVADDLTGAMDTAQGFAARGYPTTVIADPAADPTSITVDEDTAILGLNTDSRYDDEHVAANSVSNVIQRVSIHTVYKKVDSTLRGNFAPEVDAALTASGAEFALIAPAFPSAGRTTEDGIHYVNGTPVAETEYGDDDKGPLSSSLSDLFASVDRSVVQVTLSTVDAGRDHVVSQIAIAIERTDRPPILVCDAHSDTHLATIADASAEFDPLYVGSGGLAEHISSSGSVAEMHSLPQESSGAALGIAGSVSSTTLTQLEHVPSEAIVELDGETLLRGESIEPAVEQAVHRIRNNHPVIVTGATNDKAVERTIAAGQEHGLTPAEIRTQIANKLAETATQIIHQETPAGLLATGGDIAIAVMQSLDARTVSLTGEQVEAGIPIGMIADGPQAGMPLITKAGGFGTEETIVNCLDVLASTDA